MISDDKFLEKCFNNEPITCEDLGINQNLSNCHTVIEYGFRTFYTDGINYYDASGNPVTLKDRIKYGLN